MVSIPDLESTAAGGSVYWLAEVAAAIRREADEIAASVSIALDDRRLIPTAMGELGFESLRANLLGIADTFEIGHAVGTPLAALRVVNAIAEAHLPDRAITLVYYVGQSILWGQHIQPLILQTCLTQDQQVERSTAAYQLMAAYLEQVEASIHSYKQRTREIGTRAVEIESEILAVLDGDSTAERIGAYPLQAWHLLIAVWKLEGGELTQEEHDRISAMITSITHGYHSLTFRPDKERLTIWAAAPDPRTATTLKDEIELCLAQESELAAALSEGEAGREGFREVFRDAEVVRRFAGQHDMRRAVASFDDVALPALLLSDRRLATRFVDFHLKALARPEHEELRQTLLAYLAVNGSIADASRNLDVHRNTIYHRLDRARALLADHLAHRPFEVHVALRLKQYLDG